MTTATYQATGMTCEHCVHAVSDELKELAGVRDVAVDLHSGGQTAVTPAPSPRRGPRLRAPIRRRCGSGC